MSNVLPSSKKPRKTRSSGDDSPIYTSLLFELNLKAQDAVRDFSLHDIDDKEGIELKRIAMHSAFTELYDTIASFSRQIMVGDFDMTYLRNRVAQSEGETKEQLEAALEELEDQTERNLADVWMARVMAWLHTAAAASGPFVENEHEEIQRNASKYLAKVYTMLERPFSAVSKKVDGTQKLRRVALGIQAYKLMKESLDEDDAELTSILGRNKSAEAEFYDEFLNELVGQESTFRQAFNPFDELIWLYYGFINLLFGVSYSSVGEWFSTTGSINLWVPIAGIGYGIGNNGVYPLIPIAPLIFSLLAFIVPMVIMALASFKGGMDGIVLFLEYAIGMISHTVSYARIFALNTVHIILSGVFFSLIPAIIYIPFPALTLFGIELIPSEVHTTDALAPHTPHLPLLGAIIGTFIVGILEGLLGFMHTLRLHFVEWFSKFYHAGGVDFMPFYAKRIHTSQIKTVVAQTSYAVQ
jgi:hypothetical protein